MWAFLIKLLVGFAISALLRPKVDSPKPAKFDEFEYPTADETRPIPHVFGRVRIKDVNCLWFGNLKYEAIRSKGGK